VEARHPALVMAIFLQTIGNKASFVKEVLVGKDGYGLLLATGKGNVLALWSEGAPIKLSDIKEFTTSKSVLRNWEGREIALSGEEPLAPKTVYYLTMPNDVALNRAESVDRLIPPNRVQRTASGTPSATFVNDAVKDAEISNGTFWISNDWKYVPMGKGDGAQSISARALVGVHPEGVDLVVEVYDTKHVQNESDKWWQGDSLQVGIDCEGRGLIGGNMEIVAALKPDGVVFWKLAVANAGADLPAEIAQANSAMKRGECKITREGEKTVYRIRIPWSELYPMVYNPKQDLKISLLVNNNDGEGRAGYLNWGGGIGGNEKDPLQYGTLKSPAKR
jgi:hypothetical protein